MLSNLSQPQKELAEYMSALSESAYHAAWMKGLEFALWRAINEGPVQYGRLQITDAHILWLIELSRRCNGWIRFDDIAEESFVTLEEWKDVAREHTQSEQRPE